MHQAEPSPSTGEQNHPLAVRMAAIAFLNMNIAVACIYGSFSVLLSAVETRLGVGREMSTLAIPLVNLATAICAPIVGVLAGRISIRLILLTGSFFSVVGFLLLALTHSYAVYLIAFGAFLGPGLATGAVLAPTLVTRWFTANRGRAMGIATTPVVIVLIPLLSTWTLQQYGIAPTYLMLAALSFVALVANIFVVDNPPGAATANEPNVIGDKTAGISMAGLLRSPPFYALSFAYIASSCSSIIITAHMVPLAHEWGLSPTLAATLLSIQSFAGIFGTLFFGWLIDRLGGARTLTLIMFDSAILWLLLLLTVSFPVKAIIVALIGLHGAGMLPVFNVALSERFGRESFSRAIGLANLINLPFSVVAVPAAAVVFARTGSYTGALVGESVFLLFAGVFAVIVGRALAVRTAQAE